MSRTAKAPPPASRTARMRDRDDWSPYARQVDAKPCDCAGCRQRRARRMTCPVCGYHGRPLVHPCDCGSPDELQTRGFVLREFELAGEEDKAAFARQGLVEALAGGRCPCGDGAQCAHGAVDCPCCAGGEDRWSDDEDRMHPWRLVAKLRRELARAKRAQAPRRCR